MAAVTTSVAVVGAGVSGLACARALRDAGEDVLVLDRARGVGGRCATRRIEGQPADHGVAFLHGRDPAFLRALEGVPAEPIAGWPRRIAGSGTPCQPWAFRPGHSRLAFREGVAAFPRHLAAGLDVRLQVRVLAVEPRGAAIRLVLEDGSAVEARTAVLALASEQTRALLDGIPSAPAAIRSATALFDTAWSHPCLSLIAAYPAGVEAPRWDVSYPETSSVLQLVSNDSSKRARPAFPLLVLQAHASWSRQHEPDESWPQALLAEASRLYGAWAAQPAATHPHRWRWARHDASAELAAPLLLDLGECRLGVCGERFAPGTGVQGAWLSGVALAKRILEAR